MTKRWMRWLAVMVTVGLVAACGGGGGGGDSLYDDEDGGDGEDTVSMSVDVQRSGASVENVSSSETVQAVARVTDSNGDPLRGVVVTFAESGPGLLTLAPTAGTALTDAEGRASVDVAATDAANTGATTVTADATVAGTSGTASKSIQVSSSSGGGSEVTPAAAINFVSASPSGTAIVVRGSGGSGRSESATLTYKVVDGSGAPVEGANVAFKLNQASSADGVKLNTTSSTSNSSGIVTTSVTSGTVPTTVIVTATVKSAVTPSGASVSSQSDTIVVSNAIAVQEAFEIVAEKYNLDGRFTGDTTNISAFVADANGNPVADGVAISFTTDAGAVATSTLGGCLTVNGRCDVEFRVQEPRGSGLATVVATARVGDSTLLDDSIQINMAGSNSSYLAYASPSATTPVETLALGNVCTKTFELRLTDGSLGTGAGRSPAAGTTIGTDAGSSGVTATVKSGSPVPDQLSAGFPSVRFLVEVAVARTAPASCDPAGTQGAGAGFFLLNFKTPNNVTFTQRISVTYPQ